MDSDQNISRVDQKYLPVTKAVSDVFWNVREIRTNLEDINPLTGSRKITFCLPNTGLLNLESLRFLSDINLKPQATVLPGVWPDSTWRAGEVRPGIDRFFFSLIERIVFQTGGTVIEDQRELNLFNHANTNLGFQQPDIRYANNAYYGFNADSYTGGTITSYGPETAVLTPWSLAQAAGTVTVVNTTGVATATTNIFEYSKVGDFLVTFGYVWEILSIRGFAVAVVKNGGIGITAKLASTLKAEMVAPNRRASSVQMTGTAALTNGTGALTGVGTKFLTELNIGTVLSAGDGYTFAVLSITSDTAAIVAGSVGLVDLPAGTLWQIYQYTSLPSEDPTAETTTLFWEHPDHCNVPAEGKGVQGSNDIPMVSRIEIWRDSILNGRGILPLNIMPRTTLEIYFADPAKVCASSKGFATNNATIDGQIGVDTVVNQLTYYLKKIRLQALYGESPTISKSLGSRGMSMTFSSYTNYQYSWPALSNNLSMQVPVTQRAVDKVIVLLRDADFINKPWCFNKLSKYYTGNTNPTQHDDTTPYTRKRINRANIRINGIRRYPEDLDQEGMYLELRRLFPETATSELFATQRLYEGENSLLVFSVQTDYSQVLLSGTKTASQTAPLMLDFSDVSWYEEKGYGYEGGPGVATLTQRAQTGPGRDLRVDVFVCYTKFLSITKEKIELIE